jgi:hypothetical protein
MITDGEELRICKDTVVAYLINITTSFRYDMGRSRPPPTAQLP